MKGYCLVVDKLPPVDEFKKLGYLCAIPIKDDKKERWVLLRNKNEMRIYEYLQSPNDYKVKERIFNADIEGYSYVQNEGSKPQFISLQLPKKWVIEDSKIKRELEVVVTDIDQENDHLLHELYSKARDKK
ncbi:MAG TPA: hypothetical protein P5136_05660 [Methanofastidiosum sp.]|nr:hypothetical protein [Methanofastidiosum sp.]